MDDVAFRGRSHQIRETGASSHLTDRLAKRRLLDPVGPAHSNRARAALCPRVSRDEPAPVREVVDLEPPAMALHMGRPLPHEPVLQKRSDELADVLHIDCGGVRDSLLAHLRGNLRDSLVLREIGEMDEDAFLGRQAHGGTGRNADRVLRVRTYGPAGGRDNLWTYTVTTKLRRRPGASIGSSRGPEKR